MVDEIKTSDECILAACETSDVFEVEFDLKKSIQDKLSSAIPGVVEKILMNWTNKSRINDYQ